MFIFTSHNVLTESASPLEYRLLACLRAYLELTMWESLEVHTAETIAAGREAVKHLGIKITVSHSFATKLLSLIKFFMKEYNNALDDAEQYENFNFPKLHAQQHAFDDILAKRALCNFTTRLFERLHKMFKIWYERRTNFKKVAPQVSQLFCPLTCTIS